MYSITGDRQQISICFCFDDSAVILRIFTDPLIPAPLILHECEYLAQKNLAGYLCFEIVFIQLNIFPFYYVTITNFSEFYFDFMFPE